MRRCGDDALISRIESCRATQLVLRGQYADAEHYFAAVLEGAPAETSPSALLRTRLDAASVVWLRGRVDAAEERYRELLAESRTIGDRRSEMECAASVGAVLTERRRLADARPWLERALGIARALERPRSEGYALGSLAELDLAAGRVSDAEQALRNMRAIADEVGDPTLAERAHHHAGRMFLVLGRLDDAWRHADRARRSARDRKVVFAECATALLSADIALLCGAGRRAGRLLRHVLASMEPGTTIRELAAVDLARLEAMGGDAGAAEARLGTSRDWFRERGHTALTASVEWKLGRVTASQGRIADATEHFDAAVALIRAVGDRTTLAQYLCSRARLPGADAAEALTALRDEEPRLARADALTAHYDLYRATRDIERLQGAVAILDQLLRHAPEGRAAPMAERVPVYRAIRTEALERGVLVS